MQSLCPNSLPNSKCVRCHPGPRMHKSKWKLPTAQPRAPRIPDPLPHARPWAAGLASGAHACHPVRSLHAHRGCPVRGRCRRHRGPAVQPGAEFQELHAGFHVALPGAGPLTHARARANDPRGRPAGGPEGRGAAAAYLGPCQRRSRVALVPQPGPEQRAAGAGGSCSAPRPAAPAHPRPPPRCASCGQSSSLRSRRPGARARGAGGARARGASGRARGEQQRVRGEGAAGEGGPGFLRKWIWQPTAPKMMWLPH